MHHNGLKSSYNLFLLFSFIKQNAQESGLLSTGPSMDDRPWTTLSTYIGWTGRPEPRKESNITGNWSVGSFKAYNIKKLSLFFI